MNVTLKNLSQALIVGALATSSAWATMITGTTSIGGTAAVSANTITFYTGIPSCSTPPAAGVTTGCFLDGSANGSFLADSNTNGIVQDLTSGTPISGPTNIPMFITFANGVTFNLTFLPVATAPSCSVVNTAAPGITCVPGANSAFQITNGSGANGSGNAVQSTIQFTVDLDGYTGTAASGSTPYVGIFTASLNQNAQQILNTIVAGGSVANQYAATFQPAAIPEPGTLFLMGLGLVGLTTISRRFAKR